MGPSRCRAVSRGWSPASRLCSSPDVCCSAHCKLATPRWTRTASGSWTTRSFGPPCAARVCRSWIHGLPAGRRPTTISATPSWLFSCVRAAPIPPASSRRRSPCRTPFSGSAASVWAGRSRGGSAGARGGRGRARVGGGGAAGFALVAGGARGAPPGISPSLLGAPLGVARAAGGPGRLARLSAVGIAGALSCVLYLPFLKGLVPGARGVGWVALRSAPGEWLAAYGPFVLLAALASPVLAFRGRPGLHEEGEARHGERLALVLAAFALLTALLGEVLYVRDLFEPTPLVRMNTIFKLHRFAWLLLGLASSPLVERLLAPGSPAAARLAGLRRGAGPAVVLVVLAGASVYPILGTAAWLRARESEARRQKDGAARAALLPGADAEALFRAISPGDAAAAFFIARTAGAHDILLEEAGEPYTWSSRISTFTGVPAVLGWGNHEAVWRQGWAEVQRRGADVAAIYEHPGSREACDRLRAYGVKWMVVGDRERQRYGAAVAGVGRLANPVFAGDGTEVYLAGEVCAAAGRSAGGEFPAVRHERAGAAARAAERP